MRSSPIDCRGFSIKCHPEWTSSSLGARFRPGVGIGSAEGAFLVKEMSASVERFQAKTCTLGGPFPKFHEGLSGERNRRTF